MLSNIQLKLITNFLLELPQYDVSYASHILKLLNKYFGYENMAFILYQHNSFSNVFSEYERENIQSTNEVLRYIFPFDNPPPISNVYNKKFYAIDFMSVAKLPKQLRTRNVLISSQLPKQTYKESEYMGFLQSLSLYYFASIYLYDCNNNYFGRIAISKYKSMGDFTKSEVEVLNHLSRHIIQYCTNWQNNYTLSKRLSILDLCYNANLPVGIIMMSSKFSVVDSNKTAQEYCLEILDAQQISTFFEISDVDSSLNNKFKFEQRVVNLIASQISVFSGETRASFSSNSSKFCCDIIPSVTKNMYNELETLYFLYITKHIDSTRKSFDNLAQLYNLSAREVDIIHLIEIGCTNEEIGNKLSISPHTVKTHITNLFRKLDVSSRTTLLHKLKS